MIEKDIIEALIRVSKDEAGGPSPLMASLHGAGAVNCLHWTDWDEVTAHLPTEQVVALARGLTLAEKQHRWIGGSPACSFWEIGMMTTRYKNRGGIYGAGIGLLALVVAAAITIWMFSKMMEVEYGTGNNASAPLDEAKRIVGEVNKRSAELSKQPTSVPATDGQTK
jgi:hypothetical protein